MHVLAGLLRRFALDWLARADPLVCTAIMTPGYSLRTGGSTLSGRDTQYVPGTLAQLARFPGLMVTVHEMVMDGGRAALRFTQHGPSDADGMAPAAWAGIALFTWDGERLTGCVAEEDHHSRRRQLAQRATDPVETPAVAPWAGRPRSGDAEAEKAVQAWLADGDLSAVTADDGWWGHETPPLLDVTAVRVDTLFSAGRTVGFHAVQTGRYRGGLPDTRGAEGREVTLEVAGLVHVDGDGAVTGRVVRDRVGLERAVLA